MRGVVLALLVVWAGCTNEDPPAVRPADGGAIVADARALDADALDAELADVSTSSDAGAMDSTDAELTDSSSITDAGPAPDAASENDGGPSGDAGNLCISAADCIEAAEVCGRLVIENNVVVSRCGPPNTMGPARSVGGQCTTDLDCMSGLCLEDLTSECSQVCRDSMMDCPIGFACVAYSYDPGNVWIPVCNRTCTDEDDCPSGTCSSQEYQDSLGAWQLQTVCQNVAGNVPLGGACLDASDCRSGICITTTRFGVGCGACTAGEVCSGVHCVLQACTAICDDASDCAEGGALTACTMEVNLGLPDGSSRPISACTQP